MNKQIEIAKEYISKHNEMIVDEYQGSTNDQWLDVFNCLIGGVYGECRETGNNWYEIEISRFDTNSGNPFIFEFQYKDE